MRTPIHVTDGSYAKAKSWADAHKKSCRTVPNVAIGGRWTWLFTPTSVGDVVKIHCNQCDAEFDATDYTNW